MTNVQKLDIKRSELRSKLIADENMSAEDRESATKELLDTESRYQTAVALEATEAAKAEPVDHPKRIGRKCASMLSSGYYDRPLTRRTPASTTRPSRLSDELNKALKPIDADGEMPWMR